MSDISSEDTEMKNMRFLSPKIFQLNRIKDQKSRLGLEDKAFNWPIEKSVLLIGQC